MQAVLKDEALAALLGLVSEHQSDESVAASSAQSFTPAIDPGNSNQGGGSILTLASKTWMQEHSPAEVLNMIGWEANPDKILMLAAILEVRIPNESWRSADMEKMFAEAKESFPSNFPRDIAAAIKDGLIAKATERTYCVSRTGWKKVAEATSKAMFVV